MRGVVEVPENDVRKEIREELDRLIGKYIPNKIDLENFSNYLYKLCMNKMKSANIVQTDVPEVNEIDEMAFLRAVHTLALFSARDVMYRTLQETFNSVRNKVSLVEVDQSVHTVNTIPEESKMVIIPADEGDFRIDLSDTRLRVDNKTKTLLQNEVEKEYGMQKQPSTHGWSSSDKEFNIGEDSIQEFNRAAPKKYSNINKSDADNFMSDASSFTSESYSSVPEVSKGLDY